MSAAHKNRCTESLINYVIAITSYTCVITVYSMNRKRIETIYFLPMRTQ